MVPERGGITIVLKSGTEADPEPDWVDSVLCALQSSSQSKPAHWPATGEPASVQESPNIKI
jgi:hypothetical protein